ncbi:MAG: hypothetical protein JNK89_07845 [Saprospiraceae bacterium]|nr:hypothetical protein [Saprospiraceae bacterium]
MTKQTFRLVQFSLLIICTLGFAAPAFSQDEWTKEQLQAIYMRHLSQEGYLPNIDQDGDVQFKREGKTYFIPVKEDDPGFFAVYLINIYDVTPDNMLAVLQACNKVTANTKVSKVQVIEDKKVWITCETYVSHPEEGMKIFTRCLSSIASAYNSFREEMLGSE